MQFALHPSSFCGKFYPQILTSSLSGGRLLGASNKGAVGKQAFCVNISKTVRDTSMVTINN